MFSENQFVFQSNFLPQSSFNFFADMKDKDEFCDITLKMGELSISAHSIIIAAAIPYLREILRGKLTQNDGKEMHIPEVDDLNLSAVQSLIEFAYSYQIKSNRENVIDLLSAASRFQMDEVRDACCRFLAANLYPGNAMKVLDLAHRLDCSDLAESADQYMAKNFVEISQTEDFLNWPFSHLKGLIGRDDLQVQSEEPVYESVMKWIAQSPKERERHLPELITNVRLALLKPQYLRLHVARDNMICSSPLCRDWVDEITTHIMFPEEDLSPIFITKPRCFMSSDSAAGAQSKQDEICHREKLQSCENTSSKEDKRSKIDSEQQPTFPQNTNHAASEENEQNGMCYEEHCKSASSVAGEEGNEQNDTFGEQQQCCEDTNSIASEEKDQKGIYYGGQRQDCNSSKSTSSNDSEQNGTFYGEQFQCYDDTNSAANEENEPGGIYAFHTQLIFTIQHFDSRTNTWLVKKQEPVTVNTASVAGLNNKICFMDCENMCFYSPKDNDLQFVQRYIQGRAFAAIGEDLYVFGGSDGRDVFNTAECFVSESEDWYDLKDMEECRECASCVALEEHIYILGGNNLDYVHSTVERYDIKSQEWTFMEPMLTGRTRLGSAALNGRIYVCGGVISLFEQERTVTAEVYEPKADQWTRVAALVTARQDFTLLAFAGKLFTIGGNSDNDDYVNTVDVYDPGTGTWIPAHSTMASELQVTGAAAIENPSV